MQAGDRVRLKANPGRIGILGHETDGPPARQRMLVNFLDGTEEFFLPGALEKVEKKAPGPYELIKQGRYGRTNDLRGAITYYRLSGKLANLIYSMNSTNTEFLAYQFKPVLQFLDSPTNGILIADEVGLGKTIEAGLIWTELQAREDARRLLVVCPANLVSQQTLSGVPFFLSGGGARMQFYDALTTSMSKAFSSYSWLYATPRAMTPPDDLVIDDIARVDYDRLSVAYGLSRLELGRVLKALPMPKLISPPTTSWTDHYISKDLC